MKIKPNIFLSYSHNNFDVADSIDNDFQKIGITFKRDIRDVGYMESFKKYMELIRDNGYALMIISDEFLKSENCMFEVLEFMKEKDVHERILLIVLENANIFSISGKADYIKHWNNKFEEINDKIKDLPPEDSIPLIEELKKVKNIKSDIADFLKIISDKKSVPLSKLKQENYRAILEKIGFKHSELLEELFKIGNITDNEEKDIALDKFIQLNPFVSLAYFLKAYLSDGNGEYKKAKRYYEEALKIDPDLIEAHNNLGLLLNEKFNDKENAKKHFDETLRINPDFAKGHHNLAWLLLDKFDDKENAKKHFVEELKIDPNNFIAHYNLALLLENKYDDKDEARKNYEQALRINKDFFEAHYNLALLLNYNNDNDKGAKEHYEEALRINPSCIDAHNNLAILLYTKFDDKEESRRHFEESLKIDQNFDKTHFNLACLLLDKFDDKEGARKHYEEAVRLNPDYMDTHYYLAKLLFEKFDDKEGARKHYLNAILLKPDLRREELDKYFGI